MPWISYSGIILHSVLNAIIFCPAACVVGYLTGQAPYVNKSHWSDSTEVKVLHFAGEDERDIVCIGCRACSVDA